jgi:FMN reductase (NADPH)
MVWCADLSRLDRVCQLQGHQNQTSNLENLLLACVDVSLIMQNSALAAESLGLGICYVGGIRNFPQDVIDMFALPPRAFPLCGMTLGWPEKTPPIRPRLPLEAVLHWETYNVGDEDYLRAYDQTMIATGIYQDRQISSTKQVPEAEYGWMEHSARRVSRSTRPHLRDALAKAGFDTK